MRPEQSISPFLAEPRRSESVSRVIRIADCNLLFGIIIVLYEQNLQRGQADKPYTKFGRTETGR